MHEPVKTAGDRAFEAAFDFAVVLPLAGGSGGVGASLVVTPQPCERDGIQGTVERPVAAAVE